MAKKASQPRETGEADDRHAPDEGIRTCLSPVETCGSAAPTHTGTEWNIVRGED